MKTALNLSWVILVFFLGILNSNPLKSYASTSINSCDSSYIDTVVSCFPYFWDVTDTTYYFSGVYSDTFQTSQGCDSIRVLNATIYTSYISTTTAFICQGEEFIWNNRLLFQTGTYFDTLQTVNGCDSILRLNLNVDPVDTSVQRIGNSLRANLSPAASYQWFDCDGDLPIPGATGRTFIPSRTGIYKVRVNDFGCIDFSGCYAFVLSDLDNEYAAQIKIFPNPVRDDFFIEIPDEIEILKARLIKPTGGTVKNIDLSDLGRRTDLSDVSPGVYYLNLEGERFNKNLKLIVE